MAKINNLSTGKAIGIVKSLIGNATATDSQGVTRSLQIGDQVYANEIINASAAGGTIHIEFANSSFATLGTGQTLTLDNSVFAPEAQTQAPQLDEEALQAQIAAGLDPTLVAEAAAAGANAGGAGGEGGHQFVIVEQNAARGEVTAGFETSASGNELAGSMTSTGAGGLSLAQPTEPTEPTEPEGDTYNARAVMYTAESGSTNSITLTGLKAGSDVPIWKDESVKDYFNVTLAGDGTVTITLNAAGQAALLSGDLDPYSYLEIVGSDGKTYVVQVILNQDNSFNSAAEDRDTTHGASLASGGLVHGEWHSGQDFTSDSPAINPSSELGDQVVFSGNLSGATINTAGGDDTITIGGQMKGGSTILASGEAGNRATDDTNMIAVKGGMAAAAGETNLIHTNAGTVDIGSTTTQNAIVAAGGKNTIDGGSGNTDVTVIGSQTGMKATDGGINEIINARDVTVKVDNKSGDAYAVKAEKGSSNIISADGDIDISAKAKGTFAKGVVSGDGETLISSTGDVLIKTEGALSNWGVDTYASETNASKTMIEGASVSVNVDASGYTGGDNRMGVAHGVVARGAGAETSITSKGNINVSTQGSSSRAVWASDKGSNVLTADGKLIVDSKATSFGDNPYAPYVQPTGIEAASGGQNLITAGAVDVSVAGIHTAGTNVPWVRGVTAMSGSSNVIRLTGNDDSTIKVSSTNSSSTSVASSSYQQAALYASGTGGSNVIEGATAGQLAAGKVTLSGNATGKTGEMNAMYAGSSGSNVVRAQAVDLTVSSVADSARGMFAESSGKNTITSVGDVNIAATTGAKGTATGLQAGTGATNMLTSTQGDVNININQKPAGAATFTPGTYGYGMNAAGGTNIIGKDALGNVINKGDITIRVDSVSNSIGLDAQTGGKNILGTEGKVTIDTNRNFVGESAYGLKAGGTGTASTGSNTITAGAIDINAKGTTYAYGVYGTYKSTNTLDATGKVNIVAQATSSTTGQAALGVNTSDQSTTQISGSDINVSATSRSSAYGLSSSSKGNTVLTITQDGGKVSVSGKNLENTTGAYQGTAGGLYASASGSNLITAAAGKTIGTVDISAVSGKGLAMGLYAITDTGQAASKNTISNADTVNIEARASGLDYSSSGLWAANNLSTNTLTSIGTLNINATTTGGASAYGALASYSAQNLIKAGNVNITATVNGTNVSGTAATGAYGLFANLAKGTQKAINSIEATGTVGINALSTGSSAYGIYANQSGENIITKAAEVRIGAQSTGGNAYGVYADYVGGTAGTTGGTNTIGTTANPVGYVGITANTTGGSGAAYGIYGASNAINNVNAKGNVDVTATAGTGLAYGLYSTGSAANTITASGEVQLLAGSKSGSVYGLSASNSGSNVINAGGLVNIMASSDTGNAYGLQAFSSGKNSINLSGGTAGNIDITAKSASGYTYGMQAISGGVNSVKNAAGDITLTSTSANAVRGMYADEGKNALDASGNITLNAISTNSYVYGLQSVGEVYTYSTSNILTAGGAIAINVKAKTSANGLEANFGDESNILRAGKGITLTVEGENALGIRNVSRDGETTLTTKEGDVKLDIKATGETTGSNNATGIMTGGTTELTAEEGNVIVGTSSALGRADAVYTSSTGKTTLTASDLVDVQAQGATGARGVYVESQNVGSWAQNVIEAGKVNISATTAGGTAQGIYNLAGGNTVHAAGDINIGAASTTGTAYGVYTEKSNSKYGENIVISDKGAVNITASGAEAHGIFAGLESAPLNSGRGGGINTISAATVNVDVSGTGTSAAMNAKYGGSNTVSAQEVNLKASSVTGDAHGMSVMSTASKNTITADKVSIETKSDEGNAYAMKATQGGANTIQAGAGSAGIEVRIAVEAGQGKAAYAMYAQGASSVNTIMGTAGNDTISLKGDIKAESGGKNIINTGGGTNTIDLEGTISKGSLTLQTDVGGKDILILRADNAADFQAKYQTWLNEVKTSGINIIGVDVVIGGDVTGSNVNASDFAWLEGLFGQDTVHYGVHDYTEAAPMMAAFADSLDDYTDVSASHADTNDQSVNMGSESQPDMATVPLMENTENISVETSALDSTTLDITEAALAGEVVLETAQDSAHHILLADNISLPEGITYDSLVDGEGHINLDAIHTVKELLTSQEHYELHAGDSGDILFGSAGDDILIGGAGDDVLVSGTGQTTFVYEQGDLDHVTSGDKIVDFKLGEDVLDISDLLSGADKPGSVSDLFSNGFLNFDKISQNEDGTTTIKLSIDTDGSAGHASDYVPLAEMTVYGLNLGSDPTANDVLEQLVNNGSIQF